MKNLIDALVVGVYLIVGIYGGKYTLSYISHKSKMMALEKAARGLDDLTPITQTMTGKRYQWQ
jgi:uncharacterized protein YneF (UPF0154 family)